MIFDVKTIIRLCFCNEAEEENAQPVTLPQAAFTVVLVSRGCAAVAAADGAQLLRAGGLLLSGSAVQVTPAADCHLIALGFDGIAAQTAAQALHQPLLTDGGVCPLAGEAIAELMADVRGGVSDAVLSAQCYRVLCALADADETAKALPPMVAEAVLAIRQNYAGLYGVEELSAQLGVSKSHLVRVFSAAVGVPPGQYLTQVRVAAAKQLLAQREYPLEVIATLCGFSGANYFCKVFKKTVGETPAAYRARHTRRADAGEALSEWERALYT